MGVSELNMHESGRYRADTARQKVQMYNGRP